MDFQDSPGESEAKGLGAVEAGAAAVAETVLKPVKSESDVEKDKQEPPGDEGAVVAETEVAPNPQIDE